MIIYVFDRVENIVEKGQVACTISFSFFYNVFKRLLSQTRQNVSLSGNSLRHIWNTVENDRNQPANKAQFYFDLPRPGGSVVSVSESWLGGCEFETRSRRTFLTAYFRLSRLLKYVRKVVSGYGKKVVLVLLWESQETHVRHRPPWYDLSCGVKPQYNQATNYFYLFHLYWHYRHIIL